MTGRAHEVVSGSAGRGDRARAPGARRTPDAAIVRWFLTAAERGNPATRLDAAHDGAVAWSTGNEVQPLIHGATYFAELAAAIGAMTAGDLLLFTDWRGDPDERLDGPGTEVARVLCEAARRGVVVRGLVWRSHLDRLQFSERENRHLGEQIDAAGGECLLDMRVRPGGSHHQKFVVLRHPGRPERDVAFVGGIDLCHSRRDDATHCGDPQRQPMAAIYGDTPPWHDVQLAIRGPAVADVETVFRERWDDPQPLSRNPLHRIRDVVQRRVDTTPSPLPARLPPPADRGTAAVQLLRTYPPRRHGYPFAPDGERSVAHGYVKALARARRLVYLEDQYLWSAEVTEAFARAVDRQRDLRLVAVVPHHPDQDGRLSLPPNLVGRRAALRVLQEAGGDRVAVYGIENRAGTPIYVHAKVCIVDDTWAAVGSDNVNLRSWTHDSELTAAIVDDRSGGHHAAEPEGPGQSAGRFARDLRVALAAEHLGLPADDTGDIADPWAMADAFARAAADLQLWWDGGRVGPRPRGQLRPCHEPRLSAWQRLWSWPLYRLVYDPDGRPRRDRRRRRF